MRKLIRYIRHWIKYWKQSKKSVGGQYARRAKYTKFAMKAYREGVFALRVDRVATDFTNAWYAMDTMSALEKDWYVENGFNPRTKYYCGVTKDNFKHYISDFEFYNSQNYMNHTGFQWFDNKLNTYYLLAPFADNLPRHYYYIDCGEIMPLNVDTKHNCSPCDLTSLLKEMKVIVAKKCYGGHGEGFYKLEYHDGAFVVNGKEITEQDFNALIVSLNGYIITDFIKPASWIRKMAGENSFAVIRVMTIYDKQDGPQFERIMMRLGTEKAGPTQAGHDFLYVGIKNDGTFFDSFYEYSDYSWEKMDTHPETGEAINGRIMPNIDALKKLCNDISGYLPTTPYLVFDIIPTDDSFIILEINSHGQPFNFEPFDPVKGSKYFTKLFKLNDN